MHKYVFALLLFAVSLSAKADFLLDFNDLTHGMSATGTYQGVRIEGGRIADYNGDKRIRGHFSMFIEPSTEPVDIQFQATRWDVDGGYTWVHGRELTAITVQGTANPWCQFLTAAQCIEQGWVYIPPTRLFDYRTFPALGIYRIDFTTDLVDNIRFVYANGGAASGGEVVTGEIPEPGTILFAVGLLSLIGWHRQRHFQRIENRA